MKSFATPLRRLVLATALVFPMVLHAQSPRMVLIEESTNASCGPCAAQNPFFEYYLSRPHNQEYIIPVVYHANFPGRDVMNAADTAMHNARSRYYPITGVPTAIVNGRIPTPSGGSYPGAPSDTVALTRDALTVVGTMSPITIDISEVRDAGNTNIKVDLSSIEALSGKVLQIVAVERHHNYASAGTNGEKDFHYVARKMLPNHLGTTFDLAANEKKSFTQSFSIDPQWNAEEMYIVAFVQDPVTKEVLQVGTDRGRLRFQSSARTSARQQSNEPASWSGTVSPTTDGTFTVKVQEYLPAGWTSSVRIGDEVIPSGGQIVINKDEQVALNVSVAPTATKQGKGKVTVTLQGDKGAVWSESFTYYAANLQSLVILKDEGDVRIADYYEQGMAQGDVSYAVVERGDEDLFDFSRHVIVFEVGKWAMETADIAMMKQLFDQGNMRVFMIGAEIAYGLADPQNTDPRTPRDIAFLNNYLHADYISDDNPSTTVRGIADDPVGNGLSFSINSGIQNQDTPDELAPRDGAVPVFYYGTDQSRVAGIRYDNEINRLIYLGFGLEGIGNVGQRADVLKRGIAWLLGSSSAPYDPVAGATALLEAQPNPASGLTTLPFHIERSSNVTIGLYDLRGLQVATLADGPYNAGDHTARFDASGLPAGTYIAIMKAGDVKSSRMVTVVR